MKSTMFPIRWWVTTAIGATLGSQIFLALYRHWPAWVVALLILAFCALLFVTERQNEREADPTQVWWVPIRVLWSTPLRVVVSAALLLALVLMGALVIVSDEPEWVVWAIFAVTFAHRLILGRVWLKRDRAAAEEHGAVEGSDEFDDPRRR
jgi:uncharacterized membrane protein YfcA